MNRKIKFIKSFIIMMFLILVFSFARNDEANAASAYERTNVESQMMIGQKEIYSSFSWKLDGKSYRYEIEADSVVTSSDESVVKTEIFYSQGSSLSTSFYCVNVYALAEGTATIGFTYKEERIEFDIQVMSNQSAVIENFPGNCTINKGSFMNLELHYRVVCGSYTDSFWMEDCTVVSDNPAVVSVVTEGIDLKTIKLKATAAGTANITLTVNKEKIAGITKSFTVTVVQGPIAAKPVTIKQTKMMSDVYWVYCDRIMIGFKVLPADIEYEIYRSKSKNTGYTRVGSVSLEKIPFYNYYAHDGLTMEFEAGDVCTFEDKSKSLKPNTKYYYKVRARHTDSYNCNEWGEFSEPQEYWTTLKPIPNKKVKYNVFTGKAVIAKTKNMKQIDGYVYEVSGTKRLGYNMFFQPVIYSVDKVSTTKKRIFSPVKLGSGVSRSTVENVSPYVKHGKYYYAHGYKLVNKLSKFKSKNTNKFVGS